MLRTMTLPPVLIQFAVSLIAVLALAWLAHRLRLGPSPKLEDEHAARLAADAASPGFDPVQVALDRERRGALLRDGQGRVLLLRPHGAHFAGRVLGPLASARVEGEEIVVDTAERRYGAARLRLDDASAWVQAIGAIGANAGDARYA